MKTSKKLISTDIDQAFMESRTPYVSAVGAIALVLWVTIVVVQVVKGGRWAWSLPCVLLSTPIAVLVTIFLCRFRVARNKPLSYGTLLTGPFVSTCLVMLCCRFYFAREELFTFDYWNNLKGGWTGVLLGLALVGGICVLPAIAIVIYVNRGSTGSTFNRRSTGV